MQCVAHEQFSLQMIIKIMECGKQQNFSGSKLRSNHYLLCV